MKYQLASGSWRYEILTDSPTSVVRTCTMLLEQIKGFYQTKIFLLVGSYNMLSWQLIKEVSIAVYVFAWLPKAMYSS